MRVALPSDFRRGLAAALLVVVLHAGLLLGLIDQSSVRIEPASATVHAVESLSLLILPPRADDGGQSAAELLFERLERSTAENLGATQFIDAAPPPTVEVVEDAAVSTGTETLFRT